MQVTPSPLDQLADIHLPDSVSWWPLAPGWWALMALVVLALAGVFLWRQRARRNRYRQLAQQELDKLYAQYQSTRNAADFVHGLSVLLRRTALTAHPNTFNASIKGQAWLDWLDSVCPAKNNLNALQFNSDPGRQLLTASYQKNPAIDAPALYSLCRHWLGQHRNHRQKMPATKAGKPNTSNNIAHNKNAPNMAEAPHV